MESGSNAVVEVDVDDAAKDVQIGEMYIHTSKGDLETIISYTTPEGMVETSSDSWALFPNPADAFITIKGKNLGTVVVFNALGQKIETFTDCGKQLRISTSQYQNGIYYIKNTQGQIGKMVVSH